MSKNLLIIIAVIFVVVVGVFAFRNYTASDFEQSSTGNAEDIQASPFTAADTNTSTESATINCSGKPILQLTEGPYYTPNSPLKKDLFEAGDSGEKLILSGYVLDTDCKPITNAWLDFWQTDGAGNYDNSGYKYRGHQFTDESGRYTLTTVIPGEYPGRTAHIHFKVRASENSPVITSQLFIPGAAGNQTDNIYDESLLINNVVQSTEGKTADFNFVVSN